MYSMLDIVLIGINIIVIGAQDEVGLFVKGGQELAVEHQEFYGNKYSIRGQLQ